MKYGAEIEACRGLIDRAQNMGFHMAGIRLVWIGVCFSQIWTAPAFLIPRYFYKLRQ